MNIVFIASEKLPVPPVKGGAVETWIYEIARRLKDDQVTSLCVHDPMLDEDVADHGFKVLAFRPGVIAKFLLSTYRLPFQKANNALYHLPYSLWCALTARRLRADVIHVHSRPQFIPVIRLINPQSKIVLHIHNISVIGEKENIWPDQLFNKLDLVATCSQYLSEETIKRYPNLRNKVRTLYNGVNTDLFSSEATGPNRSRDTARKLNINDDDQVILFTGRLTEYKGVHILIDAFKMLADDFPSLKLLIVGGVTYSSQQETEYIQQLKMSVNGLSSRVLFTGYVVHREIPSYISLCDCVVVPSIWEEPFGVVTIEAMAMEKPVVAFKRGGITEIIHDQQDGILVQKVTAKALSQALRSLLADNALRSKLGRNAKGRVKEKFTWDKIVADVKRTYREMTDGSE